MKRLFILLVIFVLLAVPVAAQEGEATPEPTSTVEVSEPVVEATLVPAEESEGVSEEAQSANLGPLLLLIGFGVVIVVGAYMASSTMNGNAKK